MAAPSRPQQPTTASTNAFRPLAILLTACVLAGEGSSPRCMSAAASAATEVDIRRDATVKAVELTMPAVVNISTETVVNNRSPIDDLFREFFDPYYRERENDSSYSVGSGVIIDEDGHILTNHHVVSRSHRITVKLMDGREFEARPLTSTAFTDVALLKIVSKPGEKFSFVRFASDDDLLLGETVIALGNPFGLGGSVSRGILSSKTRRPPNKDEPLDIPDWLQIDASINPGNSGGPLVNLKGELMGINVAVSKQGQGIGFAIPIKRIASTLADIYVPEELGGLWFGARLRTQQRPPRILDVETGSPAAIAGLKPGDAIVSVDDKASKGSFAVVDELLRIADKRVVSLGIQRGSERMTAQVRLVREQTYFTADLIRSKLGMQVEELSAAAAARIGLDLEGGLLVQGIDAGSPAAKAQIQRGMIVTQIDAQKVVKVGRAAKLLHSKSKGSKAAVEVLIPYRRGRFIEVQSGKAEIQVR